MMQKFSGSEVVSRSLRHKEPSLLVSAPRSLHGAAGSCAVILRRRPLVSAEFRRLSPQALRARARRCRFAAATAAAAAAAGCPYRCPVLQPQGVEGQQARPRPRRRTCCQLGRWPPLHRWDTRGYSSTAALAALHGYSSQQRAARREGDRAGLSAVNANGQLQSKLTCVGLARPSHRLCTTHHVPGAVPCMLWRLLRPLHR